VEKKAKYKKRAPYRIRVKWFEKNGYDMHESGRPYHWVVYENANGRPPKGWHIHHINHLKGDNRIENLIAVPQLVHTWVHEGTTASVFFDRKDIEEFIVKWKSLPKFGPEIAKMLEVLTVGQCIEVSKFIAEVTERRKKENKPAKKITYSKATVKDKIDNLVDCGYSVATKEMLTVLQAKPL
jgi:hypothetical protein